MHTERDSPNGEMPSGFFSFPFAGYITFVFQAKSFSAIIIKAYLNESNDKIPF
jgi:hypothetical protein